MDLFIDLGLRCFVLIMMSLKVIYIKANHKIPHQLISDALMHSLNNTYALDGNCM